MSFKDIREFITFLESKGELCRITTEVDAELEITEICDRIVKSGGPALLFENVKGHDIPVLINMYGTEQRMAWALGVDHLDELVDRVRDLLGLIEGPPKGIVEKVKVLGKLANIASFQPKLIKHAPCQEVIVEGEDIDLHKFPILKCWPMDGGKYITLPLVITKDPETGTRNLGMYRVQVYDKRTAAMHWQTQKVGTQHYRSSKEKSSSKLEVAIAIGGDPVSIWSGSLPIPPGLDEVVVSGFVRKEGVELVKAKTVDLEVPAHAEIIIEGYVIPGEEDIEGPFGDHTGYYSMPDRFPVFHTTCITHRKSPIYPTIIVGRPPMEDYYMGKVTERIFMPVIQMVMPEVIDMNMPAEGVFHNLVIVSIKKEYPGQAQKVMYGLWGMGLMSLAKAIIVVDHFVNVQDISEVTWRVTNNIDPSQDIVFVAGPVDDLDHASPTPKFGSKMGIDATAKGEMDGRRREWPPDIIMTPEIKELVNRKWEQYWV